MERVIPKIDRVRYGDREFEVKTAKGSVAAATTDGAVLSGVTGKNIYVLSMKMSARAAATATLNSKPAGAGVAISEQFNFAANAHVARDMQIAGYYYKTIAAGEGLTMTTVGAGGIVDFQLNYIEV